MLRKTFVQQMEELEQKVYTMAQKVEEMFESTIEALMSVNKDLAKEIYESDDEIDEMNHSIERQCMNILALQQPLASDLRMVASFLKIIGDIERIADQCADVCEIIKSSALDADMPGILDVVKMYKDAQSMYKSTLKALKTRDIDLAIETGRADDNIDKKFSENVFTICGYISDLKVDVIKEVDLLFITKYIERMADHCANITGWVVYMQTGSHKAL